jgi:penicillin-binding protein 1A
MIFGIFMIYVKTTLTPTLKVSADEYTMNLSSVVYYQDKDTGEWKELQTLKSNENRVWVDYDQIPDALWQAAVSIEDKRFFDHHGVDWSRTASAAFNMFIKNRNTYGGSTITQQLIKNMTHDDEGTVKRKVTEIFRALEFEKSYSKQEILELYLNTIYLGNSCYGVQTASQYYFGKDVGQLTPAECAALVGITNNPSMYAPMRTTNSNNHVLRDQKYVDWNKSRQETILKEMWDNGYLDEASYNESVAETLDFNETAAADETEDEAATAAANNSYFVDQVITDVISDMQEQFGISKESAISKVYYGGYSIYTTIDPAIQEIAESVYEDRSNLDVTSKSGQQLQSGITIVDVTNGDVVAMVGGIGEKQGDRLWNYATGTRQCGSSIKPLTVYAPALDSGAITMASTFDNYPVRELNGNPWPKNSPQGYSGWTTLSKGVASSINTVAVRTIEKLGVNNSYEFATQNLNLDLTADDINESSLGLGGLTHGVNTEEMAAAYASFANDGVYNSPRLYTKVEDSTGNTVLDNQTETHVAMKETTAYFMNELLQGVVSGGTGTSANFGNMAIAGKTGTTSENYDRYFCGYTPYYAAAVWTGYDQNEKISYSGNPAITMWKKVMSQVHANLEYKSFDKPTSGLTTVTVCADSGLLATDACAADLRGSRVRTVTVAAGTEPTESCNLHTMVDYCTEGQCLAGPGCPAESVKQVAVLDYSRTDYGPSIVADDNAYLLATLKAIPECPVHGATAPPDGGENGDGGEGGTTPGEGGTTGGEQGGTTGGETGGTTTPGGETTPTEPANPEDGYGGNWWNNLWGEGQN